MKLVKKQVFTKVYTRIQTYVVNCNENIIWHYTMEYIWYRVHDRVWAPVLTNIKNRIKIKI